MLRGGRSGRLRGLAPAGLLAVLLAGARTPSAATAPAVVASIPPAHSLVAAVMEGAGRPVLLVRGQGSPHAWQLRPSDARTLARADVVFWIGPRLETFLVRPLETLAGGARVVRLDASPGISRLPARAAGTFALDAGTHAHGHAHNDGAHGHGADEDAARHDPHVWLDPRNGARMAAHVAHVLGAVDAPNAARYRANADAFAARLRALDRALERRLRPLRDQPFVVFHDAYRYFEHRYGLRAAGAVTVGPQRLPSARQVNALRDRIDAAGVRCVFREPQFEPRLIDTLTEGTSAGTGVLDPLGAGLEPGPELYPTLLERLADSIVECLGRGRD